MTACFCASGWLIILKTFSSETPVIFGAIDFENEWQNKSHFWLMKQQIKWTANFAIMYGNFCSLDLCLHDQIVHNGNSSLAIKVAP